MMIKRTVGRCLAGLVAAVGLLNVTPGLCHAEQADAAGPSAAALSAAVTPGYVETVSDHGLSSNIWIVFADGYVSALYFDGGQ
ncbi:hypothetical protein ABZ646_47110 [Streptomyces sp. NPDC007162]|uniref:hypothetical protein n=1 Tax=Streptomyces sp. NPDC007162 TaxID=3156917 RepID=UPI0033C05AB3